jgi:hypothetical protein
MSIFTDVADQWQIADDAFGGLEQAAFAADDDQRFDAADEQRKRNDQAYFLFLFTRFEDAVNEAVTVIVGNRVSGAAWAERRVWETWFGQDVKDIRFMSKIEVLIDKSLRQYGIIRDYYRGRNDIAHGGIWNEQFLIPNIAQAMETITGAFPTS